MNYRWSAVLMLGTLMALPLGIIRADEGGPMAGEAGHGKEMHGHWGMDITSDQKAKLKAVREAEEKDLKPFMRKQRDLSIKLHDQLDDKASDADLERTLSDLKANREVMKTESKRFMSQREAIFTPTQRAEMMLARMHRMEHRGMWEHDKMDRHDRDGEDDHGHHHDGDDHDDGGDHDGGGKGL